MPNPVIVAALGEIAAAIEHVGSTAVPGLAAKPIVDIDVLLTGAAHLPEAINRLARLDYEHQGDVGIPDREAFRSPHDTPSAITCVRTRIPRPRMPA